jgi:hypothetical protein
VVAFGPAILPRGFVAGTNGQVSWLETSWLFLPSAEAPVDVALSKPLFICAAYTCNRQTKSLTVAGPRRIFTGFLLRGPFVVISCRPTLAPFSNIAQGSAQFAIRLSVASITVTTYCETDVIQHAGRHLQIRRLPLTSRHDPNPGTDNARH